MKKWMKSKKKIKNAKHLALKMLTVLLALAIMLITACGHVDADQIKTIRIGSLKGPTTLGLLQMMNANPEEDNAMDYDFQMMTAADELLPLMIKGELDIALIPANVASILYSKMEGNLCVIDINTLGVLYMVSGNKKIDELKDLEGQTLYMTGKGTTPDYVLRYLLTQSGVDVEKIRIEFKSEATEVAAMLAEKQDAVGLLPQPFVTAALAQNDKLSVVMDLTKQWDALQKNGAKEGRMVTGVTVVRKEFLDKYPKAVHQFLKDHGSSVDYVNGNLDQAAIWAVEQGIIGKEPLAKKAIPQCNIVCITGEEMKDVLSGYLQVLYQQSTDSVGGKLPAEDFYFIG